MSSSEKVGMRIRTYRERFDLPIEQLTRNAGLDVSLVQDVEEGKAPIRPHMTWKGPMHLPANGGEWLHIN